MLRRNLILMAWFVLAVWALMIVADIYKGGYNPPKIVYGIPTLIVGALAFLIRHLKPKD